MNETTTVTLYELLSTYWIYPFPHLALFILVVTPIDTYCLFKKGSKRITASIVSLSTIAALISIYWSFVISGSTYSEGDRVSIAGIYPLSCLLVLVVGSVLYSLGVKNEIIAGRIRITAIRAPLFLVILFLYALSVSAPYRVNKMLEKPETEAQNQTR